MNNINKIFINENATLYNAILQLNKTGTRCLFVIGKSKIFKGTLTDGDIRRYIIKDKNFNVKISKIYNKKPFFVHKNKISNNSKLEDFLKKNKSLIVPVVNNKRIPINYLPVLKNGFSKKVDNLVLIMAGGHGSRLKPYTDILPKPLIPINNKPMILNILDKFKKANFNNFLITVKKNDKILESFLNQFSNKYKLTYFKETSQLGTGGCLKKIKNQKNPFFMINCDSFVSINPKRILNTHTETKSILTMVVCLKSYQVPYGECEVNKKGFLKDISEKPSKKLMTNVGMYLLSPEIKKFLPKDESFGMDLLIKKLLKLKKKICIFPIKEDEWKDTGNWNGYFKALQER